MQTVKLAITCCPHCGHENFGDDDRNCVSCKKLLNQPPVVVPTGPTIKSYTEPESPQEQKAKFFIGIKNSVDSSRYSEIKAQQEYFKRHPQHARELFAQYKSKPYALSHAISEAIRQESEGNS